MMILMKALPVVPGHFTGYEWLALAIWAYSAPFWMARARESAGVLERDFWSS